ncbi:MAG TPA: hypothetical protein VG326_19160 [Tepidisphaeraceae bacterium]|jgi:hypothetical protein|nr:hypothetical protein [Tepidisphaeraceae bacterium]
MASQSKWILAAIRCAFLISIAAPAPAGEILYNGIELPAPWPPADAGMKPGEPMPIPYLKEPPAVIPIDIGRQLFVDDFLIQSTTLHRVHHLAELYEGNPVVKPDQASDKAGKGSMAMPFSDGVWFDPKDQLFKMWYIAGYMTQTAYATSRDGLHWEKPALDVKPMTNVVHVGVRDSSTVWLDLEESDPGRRFKMWTISGPNKGWRFTLHFSPDGIHWGEPVLQTAACGDRSTVFRNPFRKVWVYSLRTMGGSRARRYWEVRDLLAGPQWAQLTDATPWLGSDRLDPKREDLQVTPQLYNLDAVGYESVMLGLFSIWHGDKNIPPGRPKPNSICVGYSRDGFHWDRPDRRPFIGVSESSSDWNWGNVQSVGGCCLVVGDKLWFYFSGRSGMGPKNRDAGGATGLAFLRRDGFASMEAGAEEGSLTTRPIKFSGGHLFVNLAAASGELRVEALGQNDTPIAPFTAENCRPLRLDKTLVAVKWNGESDLAKLAGQAVKFRFHMKSGALYSFWVTSDMNGASHGYRAAGGPGFTGNQNQ